MKSKFEKHNFAVSTFQSHTENRSKKFSKIFNDSRSFMVAVLLQHSRPTTFSNHYRIYKIGSFAWITSDFDVLKC